MDTVFAILDTTVSNIGVFSENGYDFPKFGYSYFCINSKAQTTAYFFQ